MNDPHHWSSVSMEQLLSGAIQWRPGNSRWGLNHRFGFMESLYHMVELGRVTVPLSRRFPSALTKLRDG